MMSRFGVFWSTIVASSIAIRPRWVCVLGAFLSQWIALTARTASTEGRLLLCEVSSSDHLNSISNRLDRMLFRPSSMHCLAYLQKILGRFENLKAVGSNLCTKTNVSSFNRIRDESRTWGLSNPGAVRRKQAYYNGYNRICDVCLMKDFLHTNLLNMRYD